MNQNFCTMLMAVLLIVSCPAITGFHHLSKGVSQHKPPTLDVKWAANGNMTLQYGNLVRVLPA